MIVDYDFNVDQFIPEDQKLTYELGKEIKFDNKDVGKKSTKTETLPEMLESPAIMTPGITKNLRVALKFVIIWNLYKRKKLEVIVT